MTPEQRRLKNANRTARRKADPTVRARDYAATRRWYYGHPVRRMLGTAKIRAREKGIAFDIEEIDVEVPEVCPALGIPLRYGPGGRGPDSPSLDRLIPDKGYVRGNVKIISDLANRIKQDATPEQVMAVAKWFDAEARKQSESETQ